METQDEIFEILKKKRAELPQTPTCFYHFYDRYDVTVECSDAEIYEIAGKMAKKNANEHTSLQEFKREAKLAQLDDWKSRFPKRAEAHKTAMAKYAAMTPLQRQKRNRTLYAERLAGKTLAAVSDLHGVSRGAIQRIVAQEDKRRRRSRQNILTTLRMIMDIPNVAERIHALNQAEERPLDAG